MLTQQTVSLSSPTSEYISSGITSVSVALIVLSFCEHPFGLKMSMLGTICCFQVRTIPHQPVQLAHPPRQTPPLTQTTLVEAPHKIKSKQLVVPKLTEGRVWPCAAVMCTAGVTVTTHWQVMRETQELGGLLWRRSSIAALKVSPGAVGT